MSQENKSISKDSSKKSGIKRRDLLKGLAALPVLGAFVYKFIDKRSIDQDKRQAILEELGISEKPAADATGVSQPKAPAILTSKPGNLIRLGIIGNGGRGESLIRSAGIAHPEWVEEQRKNAEENKMNTSLRDWLNQDDLNVVLTGVCDVFDVRAERGLAASKNEIRPGGASGPLPGA
ncbi:MAG TPA: gfo/Idh/MocA family oxidoreductase, partial [bacterium]